MKIAKALYIICLAIIVGLFFTGFTGLHYAIAAIPVAIFGFGVELGFIPMPANALGTNFGAITTVDVVEIDGRESMGGYTMTAYLWLLTDVSTFPTEPDKDTVTAVKDLAKLIGAFGMKASKYMIEVKVKPGSLSLDSAGQGETSGKSFKPKIQFFIPGIDPNSSGLARYLNNKFGGLIIPDPSGEYRAAIGTQNLPCEFKPSAKSGSKSADAKGFTFDVECDSFAPVWFYEGAIPLSGSTLVDIS